MKWSEEAKYKFGRRMGGQNRESSVEEVRALLDEVQIEGSTLWYRWEGNIWVVLAELVIEALEERAAMEFNEAFAQLDVHLINVAGVGPVGVVDGRKYNALALASKSS